MRPPLQKHCAGGRTSRGILRLSVGQFWEVVSFTQEGHAYIHTQRESDGFTHRLRRSDHRSLLPHRHRHSHGVSPQWCIRVHITVCPGRHLIDDLVGRLSGESQFSLSGSGGRR